MSEDKEQYVVAVHDPIDQRKHPVFRAFDRPIAFHRIFVDIAGSIAAALMLSQAVYWSTRTKNPAGWFYKTADDWQEETGLTRREQEGARKRLSRFVWWQEDLRKANGTPTLHFRVDAKNFAICLSDHNSVKPVSPICENPRDLPICENPVTETTTENTTTRASARCGRVFAAWQDNMPGTMSASLVDQINDLVSETSEDSVMEGIKVAVANGRRKLTYVRGVALRHASGEGAPAGANGRDDMRSVVNLQFDN